MPYRSLEIVLKRPVRSFGSDPELYRLGEALVWYSAAPRPGCIEELHIPAGSVTDYSSYPEFFPFMTTLLGDPHETAEAAIPHDRLYATAGLHPFTRKQADLLYREILIETGVPSWRAEIAYRGLRVGGWWPWRQALKRNQREAPQPSDVRSHPLR